MAINKIYSNPNITGECLLKPFKKSKAMLLNENKSAIKTCCDLIKRIVAVIFGAIGVIVTSPLVLIGLIVKSIAKTKDEADIKTQQVNQALMQPSVTSLMVNSPGETLRDMQMGEVKPLTVNSPSKTPRDGQPLIMSSPIENQRNMKIESPSEKPLTVNSSSEKSRAEDVQIDPIEQSDETDSEDEPDIIGDELEDQEIDTPSISPPESKDIVPEKNIIRVVHKYPGDLKKEQTTGWTGAYNCPKLDDPNEEMTIINNGVTIKILRQDIFASGAKVIVNAANTHLGGGGGIDGAIHRVGGFDYEMEHTKLQKTYDANYVEGHSAMIGSGKLADKKIENVFVVAGPSGDATSEKEDQLYSCYYNSLELAHKFDKTSLAFPSISTGIFAFPKDRAAAISLRALIDFFTKYPETKLRTVSIHFLPTSMLPEDKVEENSENILDYSKAWNNSKSI